MYPFRRESHVYPRNAWYVAAWSSEVSGTQPLGRTILGLPVVMFRDTDGHAVALDGRCAHRRYPLAAGSLANGQLACGYHGWQYGADGRCSKIPSQDRVPESFRNHAFPLVERWQWLWIWPGDATLADLDLIPDHGELHLDTAEWKTAIGGRVACNARYQLINENVLDLTHLSYTHAATIGSGAVVTSELKTQTLPTCYRHTREIKDDAITPFHAEILGYGGRIDRLLITDFYAPALISSGSRFSAASEPGRVLGEFRVMHAPTPETATTTHYFWGYTRTFARDDTETTERMAIGIAKAVEEDRIAIEAQERMLAFEASRADLSAAADEAALHGRLLLEQMMNAEQSLANRAHIASVDPVRM